MNTEDYFKLYRILLEKIIEYAPDTDKSIIYHLGDNKQFVKLFNKYGNKIISINIRNMLIDMIEFNIIKGTIAAPSIPIENVTFLGYSLFDEMKQPTFLEKIKKVGAQIAKSSFTEIAVGLIAGLF